MKEILGFHLNGCPYCANASRAIDELVAENPAYADIHINWVEDQDAHELFKTHASYVRNSLVWASQGIYSKYEYLERIFFDAILHESPITSEELENSPCVYEKVGEYVVKNYKEQPHRYVELS